MEPKTTNKRIVSKGEYAATQTSRALLRTSAVFSLVEVLICIALAVGVASANYGLFGWIAALFFAVMAFRLGRLGMGKLRQAARLEEVLPLTQANAILLPPTQTLVRASSPSAQAQQNILLRATRNDQQTPADQLLRSTDDNVNTVDTPVSDSLTHASPHPMQTQPPVLFQVATAEAQAPEQVIQISGGQE